MGWIKNAVVLFVWPGFGWVKYLPNTVQKYNTTLKQKLNVFPLGFSQQMSKTTENRNHEVIWEMTKSQRNHGHDKIYMGVDPRVTQGPYPKTPRRASGCDLHPIPGHRERLLTHRAPTHTPKLDGNENKEYRSDPKPPRSR